MTEGGTLRVRAASTADAAAIRDVHQASIRGLAREHYSDAQIEAWAEPRDVNAYKEAIQGSTAMIVAESEGRIAGFAELLDHEVRAVHVDPPFARRGIGSMLLRALERTARNAGTETLTLDASLNAQGFFEANGYQAVEKCGHELPSGVMIPCVRMRKKLSP